MEINKPPSVLRSDFQSQKWDELTKGRDFQESDIPALSLLCQWYEVLEQCYEDISIPGGGVQLVYANEQEDIKAMPQLNTMKQASNEIRQLNKQLGINDQAKPSQPKVGNVISVIAKNRANRSARAKMVG